jgi:hypothetical protein
METVDGLHPLASLLRRYAFAYTGAHDFEVCREIMVSEYALRMGEHEIRGREESYIPATAKQFRQFPGLGFTVHELVLGHDRAALRFTEHGRSVLHGGYAAWRGISMYRWNGQRLAECRVEQDYFARRDQLECGTPEMVDSPCIDPWVAPAADPDPDTEAAVRTWLRRGGLSDATIGSLDNERTAEPQRILISRPSTTILDLFTAGRRAVFHVVQTGTYSGGLPALDGRRGFEVSVYVCGIATVDDRGAITVAGVTDRLAAERRLAAARRRG